MADLNGDKKPDIAVACYGSVSVLLNKGDGTFVVGISYAAGTEPFAVAAADLNGDGRPDLAVADQASNNVNVLINACVP